MASEYFLQVVPTDGPTLSSDTRREWTHDADFTVVETDYMPFQHTWRERRNGFKFHITRQDVVNAETHYDIRFDLTFITHTIKEHFKALAKDDYGIQQSLVNWQGDD